MRHWIVIVLCVVASAAQAQLTGENREDYIAGQRQSCYEVWRGNPSNSKIADDQIRSYCSCKATYFADHTNEQQVREFADSIKKTGVVPEALKQLNERANRSCTDKLSQAANPSAAAEAAGQVSTVADAALKNDIVANLSNAHKIYHPECKEATVTRAKTLNVTVYKVSEEWVMAGCGKSFVYTVWLIADGRGGTWISIPRDPMTAAHWSLKSPTNIRDWVKLHGDSGTTAYVNPKSVLRLGDIAAMWVMFDYKTPHSGPSRYMSKKLLMEFNCKDYKARIVSALTYAENMGAGQANWTEDVIYPWDNVPVGSSMEASLKIACGK